MSGHHGLSIVSSDSSGEHAPRPMMRAIKKNMQTFIQPNHPTASQHGFGTKTFRIIHPFHPYRNVKFEIYKLKRTPGEYRVLFYNMKGRKSSVPLAWTDIALKDPFAVVSAGRALFRVEDLIRLSRLIGEIKNGFVK